MKILLFKKYYYTKNINIIMNNNVRNYLPNPIRPIISQIIGNNIQRYYLSIKLRPRNINMSILLIVLCNPASIDGMNNGNFDHTIKLIINNVDLINYYKIIIVNVIPLISTNLQSIYYNDNNYLERIKNINNQQIINVLRNNNNITKILFASGQHFTKTNGIFNNTMRDYFRICWIEIFQILNNYRNILFCLGFTQTTIQRNKLPYFPSNWILRYITFVDTIYGPKYNLIRY